MRSTCMCTHMRACTHSAFPQPSNDDEPFCTHVTTDEPPTPHSVGEITKHEAPDPPHLPHDIATTTCAQLINTGAHLACTDMIDILHHCHECSQAFTCKGQLAGSIGEDGDHNLGVFPQREGHLHIPATSTTGCLQVCCTCSPHFTTTMLCKDDAVWSHPGLCL